MRAKKYLNFSDGLIFVCISQALDGGLAQDVAEI
jgi:hypothetical protein